jgi:imidazolonepropionase-like amidohydrolase
MRATLLIAVAAALFAGSANAQVTLLSNATLIDGTGAPPQGNVTIIMDRGRISDIVRQPAVIATQGATTINLAGKFVVPGIINAHGHVGPSPRDPQLRQYARYGVTTTTSMSFDDDDIADFKSRQKFGVLNGARILTVKYRFMSEPFVPGSEYKTPDAGRAKVDEIVANGADFVKVWIDSQGGRRPKLSREFVAAVFAQARNYRKLTMAHIVELADARMVIDEGVNIIVHNVRDQEVPADFLALLKQKNVSVISTLAREEGMFVYGNEGQSYADDPFFLKGLTPEQLARLRGKREEQAKEASRPAMLRAFETDKINVKRMSDAGVRLGFGTDSGGESNRYFIQGSTSIGRWSCCGAGLPDASDPDIFEVQFRNARDRQGFRHARQRKGRRLPGAGEKSARRHRQHAHDGSRVSGRQEVRIITPPP